MALGIGWPAFGPRDQQALARAQVRYLASVMHQRAADMQELFPEGELFTYALTGLAAANLAAARPGPERPELLDITEQALAAVNQQHVAEVFGTHRELEHGAFYHGWRLLLLAGLLTDDGTDRAARYRDRAHVEAVAVSSALGASPTGMVTSYPGRTWPCDNVVAMAAAAQVLGTVPPGWGDRVLAHVDPGSGLLPHEVDPSGATLDPPRGSSQSLIQAFWPRLGLPSRYGAYSEAFVVREVGLVGVREHPVGVDKAGDIDSGPLVRGVSLSASAVGLAAARANGDTRLADSLDREADLLGLPWQWNGSRRYAMGELPVGDAFLAWARTVPVGPQTPGTAPLPWWGSGALVGLVLLSAGFWLWLSGTYRPRRTPDGHQAADPAAGA